MATIGIGTVKDPTIDITKLKMPTATNVNNLNLPQTPTAPVIPVSTTVKTSDLTKNATPQVIDTSGIVRNIQSTLDKAPTALVNPQGLNGLLRIAGVADNSRPDLLNKPLKDVIASLNISDRFTGSSMVVNEPIITPGAQKQPVATSKVETPQTAPKTINEQMDEFVSNYTKDAETQRLGIQEEVGLTGKSDALAVSDQAISDADARLEAYNLGLTKQGVDIKSRPVLLGDINQALSRLDDNSKLDLMMLTMQKNNAIADYNVKLGDYNRASEIVKETAPTMKEAKQMALNEFAIRQGYNNDEKELLQKNFDNEMDLAEKGYVNIPSTDLAKVQADIASGKKDGKIITNPVNGQSYWKPSEEDETSNSLVLDMAGKYMDAGILPTDTLAVAQAKLKSSRIYQDQVRGPVGTSGGGTMDGVSTEGWLKLLSMGQATIANVPQKIRNEVVKALAESGGQVNKDMSQSDITKITDFQSGLSSLTELRKTISDNLQYVGPISGFQAINPWSKARQVQANIDKVKQTVGKALEGGVLRKEDEEKYKKILSTINDTPETATYKIDSLKSSLERDLANYITVVGEAGRYVGGVKQPSALDIEGLRNTYKY